MKILLKNRNPFSDQQWWNSFVANIVHLICSGFSGWTSWTKLVRLKRRNILPGAFYCCQKGSRLFRMATEWLWFWQQRVRFVRLCLSFFIPFWWWRRWGFEFQTEHLCLRSLTGSLTDEIPDSMAVMKSGFTLSENNTKEVKLSIIIIICWICWNNI